MVLTKMDDLTKVYKGVLFIHCFMEQYLSLNTQLPTQELPNQMNPAVILCRVIPANPHYRTTCNLMGFLGDINYSHS